MGIKLKWDDQTFQSPDAIEIYRSTNKIDSTNPGTPLATLAASATAYEDVTVVNKNTYYYRIAVKKGTDIAWSDNILAGYYSETGPGNSMPLRGDWQSCLMDFVPPANFITMAALKAKLPAIAGFTTAEPSMWYKFFRNGKVLFIPNVAVINATWVQLYNAGLVYGTNDTGPRPAGVAAGTVNQYTTVDINGLRYLVRCPRMSNLPFNQLVTAQADTVGSEWRDTMARCLAYGVETQPEQKTRLYDDSNVPLAYSPHYTTTTTILRTASATQPETWNSLSGLTAQSVALVLELVMP